jgi:aspartyl-tRNA(Asn)/glutamyl-tRNA(Gln) amidotransferase subunit C
MPLHSSEVLHVAALARLAMDEAEARSHAASLDEILEFVAVLDTADIAAVEPMAHPLAVRQRLRRDVVSEGDQRERFQAIAPAVEDGLYLVPRVLE